MPGSRLSCQIIYTPELDGLRPARRRRREELAHALLPPVSRSCASRRAVVVGGGEEALRKVRLLLKIGGDLTSSPTGFIAELDGLVTAMARITWPAKRFDAGISSTARRSSIVADEALDEAGFGRCARPRHSRQCRRPRRTVDLHHARHRRSRPGRGRDRHRRCRPGARPGHRARIEAMLPPRLGALATAAERLARPRRRTVAPGYRAPRFLAAVFLRLDPRQFSWPAITPAYARELEAALAGSPNPDRPRLARGRGPRRSGASDAQGAAQAAGGRRHRP